MAATIDNFLRGSPQQSRSRYTGVGNGVYDNVTDKMIYPGDPEWQPEWSAVIQQNAEVASHSGQHSTFDPNDTGDPNNFGLRTPKMVDNPSMLQDPEFWLILSGMGGIGAAGLMTGGAGFGAGAGTGAADASAGGVVSGLPGSMATLPATSTAASAVAPAVTASGAPVAATGGNAVGSMYAAGGPEAGGAASSAVQASVPAVAGKAAMDPFTLYLLASSAMSAYGSYKQSQAANNASQLSQQQFEEQRSDTRANALANFLTGSLNRKDNQANQGVLSTQLNPYAQQDALNKDNVRRSFAAGYTPGKGFSGSFDMSALDPNSLAGAKTQFDKYAAAASPNVPISGDPSAEAFRQTYSAGDKTQQQTIQNYLSSTGPQGSIAQIYADVTGGKYQPSEAELNAYGPNVDSQYLAAIKANIQKWWAAQTGNPNGMPGMEGSRTMTPPTSPTPGSNG